MRDDPDFRVKLEEIKRACAAHKQSGSPAERRELNTDIKELINGFYTSFYE